MRGIEFIKIVLAEFLSVGRCVSVYFGKIEGFFSFKKYGLGIVG